MWWEGGERSTRILGMGDCVGSGECGGGGEGGGVVGKGLGGSGERYATTKYPPFSDIYQSEADIHSHSCNPMWPESLLKANTSGF